MISNECVHEKNEYFFAMSPQRYQIGKFKGDIVEWED